MPIKFESFNLVTEFKSAKVKTTEFVVADGLDVYKVSAFLERNEYASVPGIQLKLLIRSGPYNLN